MSEAAVLVVLVFAAAVLYSSVGHAGASGYLAAMALVGVSAAVMKPTALVLNVLVATVASVQFLRAGRFSWPVFWPFAVASYRSRFSEARQSSRLPSTSSWWVRSFYTRDGVSSLGGTPYPQRTAHRRCLWRSWWGALIGVLSGLVGVGGGIFLSPLLLFMGWAETRETAGVSAVFILVNSIAGLAGHVASLSLLPTATPALAVAAFVGGLIGASYGATRLSTPMLRTLLAVVLAIAGTKMLVVL